MNLVNNNNYPNYGGYNAPYSYGQQQVAQPKMTQLLTAEQLNQLAKHGKQNELQIEDTEFLAALCCHRKDGKSVLQTTVDNKVYCPICKQTFNMVDGATEEEVRNVAETLLDIMQTTKAMYVDIGEQVGQQFFQIMPLIKRTPALYRLAAEDIARYENVGAMQPASGMGGYGLYNTMVGMGYPAYGYNPMPMGQPQMPQGYGYPQAPYGAYPQQPPMAAQPMMQQAPVYNQGYAPQAGYAPVDSNPFVANGAPVQQQPAPMAPQAAPAQAAPQQPMVTKNETFVG